MVQETPDRSGECVVRGVSQRAVGYRAGPFVGLKEEKIGYEDLWCRRCSVEILSRCNQFGSNLVDMRLAVGGRHL